MKKGTFFKVILISLFSICVYSYINNREAYNLFVSKWMGFIVPVIWGVFIAMLIHPSVKFFENKLKLKRVYSLILVIFIFIAVVLGLFISIIPQIISSVKELISKSDYILERVNSLSKMGIDYLSEKGIGGFDTKEAMEQIGNIAKENIGSMKDLAVSIFMNVIWWIVGLTNFAIGLMLAILIIANRNKAVKARDELIFLTFGERKYKYVRKKMKRAYEIFLNYLVGKGIVSVIMSVFVSVILMLTKTPYSIMIGLMIGMGNMIPYVGSIVFGIVSVFIVLIMEPSKIIWLFVSMILVQALDGFVLGPKIVGDKVGLSSFWVIVSIIVFGGMFGIVGMFLAVPFMSILMTLYEDFLEYKREQASNKNQQINRS